MLNDRRKTDKVIWWMMTTFMGIIILGGGAWCGEVNNKMEKIASLEVNIQYIKSDVSEIKDVIKTAIKER